MLPQTSVFLIFLLAFQIGYSVDHQCPMPAALNFNEETFAAQVVPNKPHFVMFFVPWCPHCRRLYPTWQALAEEYNQNYENEQEVVIGKVDCTIEEDLCATQDVTSFPTLDFFKYGPDLWVTYDGGERDNLQSLVRFINEQMQGTSKCIYT